MPSANTRCNVPSQPGRLKPSVMPLRAATAPADSVMDGMFRLAASAFSVWLISSTIRCATEKSAVLAIKIENSSPCSREARSTVRIRPIII